MAACAGRVLRRQLGTCVCVCVPAHVPRGESTALGMALLGSAASWAELCLHMTVAPIPSNYVELLCARVCSASEKG